MLKIEKSISEERILKEWINTAVNTNSKLRISLQKFSGRREGVSLKEYYCRTRSKFFELRDQLDAKNIKKN